MAAPRRRSDNALRPTIVTTPEQLQDAYAVRSIVYMEGNGLPSRTAFDGNDFSATHFVLYDGDEPIGAARVRWFADFAKIERTAFREAHRNMRNIRALAEYIFAHVARKGYTKLITHAEEKYSRVWVKLLGFELLEDRPVLKAPGFEPHLEMVKHLTPPDDAIRPDSHPSVLFRTEGAWDAAAAFG
jgi:hypothetical protein